MPIPTTSTFSDGLTDEIITDLSQIRMLRVISRNSSMQLKGAGKDLKALASELGVHYVVSGSVRTSGSAVRITAQLVDPVKDETVWGGESTQVPWRTFPERRGQSTAPASLFQAS